MSRLVIEIPDEVHASLRRRAVADGRTVAWLVRSWVEAYLESREPLTPYAPAVINNAAPVNAVATRRVGVDLSKGAQAKGGSRK